MLETITGIETFICNSPRLQPNKFFCQIINYKIKIQLGKDHMNLTNKGLIDEFELNDFII